MSGGFHDFFVTLSSRFSHVEALMTSGCNNGTSGGISLKGWTRLIRQIAARTDQALFQMHQKEVQIGRFPPPACF